MSKVSHNRQGGNNFSCRVIVLIFTILAIGCAACANIFPLLKKGSDAAKVKQTLWYNQTTVSGGVGTKVDVSESLCGQYKLFFQASEGAAVGAAGIGLVVLGLAIAQLILEEKSSRFTCCAASLISLAFAACGACVALIVYGYMRGYCQSDAVLSSQYGPFKDQGYKFSEAFYLICAACGLFLLSSFFQCCA
ncbi:putative Amastin surface glycoprotein [Trypanosoma cruzi]|nr:putative Amastin surface glycoprotein [Trypanosoma cruzi]